jgi:hypothetical protein
LLPPPEEPLDELLLLEPDELFELLDELRLLDPEELFFELLEDPFELDEPLERDELRLRLLFDFVSATFMHLVFAGIVREQVHLVLLRAALPRHRQAVEELSLEPVALLVGNRAVGVVELDLQQLALDVVLVVEAPVGLVGDLLGNPGRAADWGKRKKHQFLEEAHA